MSRLTRFVVIVLLLTVAAFATQAQDDMDLPQEITLNEITLHLPEHWGALLDPNGMTLAADFDIAAMAEEENPQVPDDPVVMRFILAGVPYGTEPLAAVDELRELLGVEADGPEISEVEFAGVTAAQLSITQDDATAYAFGRYLMDDLFLVGTVVGTTARLEESLDTVQAIYASAEASLAPLFTDELLERAEIYSSLPQSETEDGFPIIGNPDADAKVQEIGSFACPACRLFHEQVYDTLLDRIVAGDVEFTYVPIASTGNVPNGVYAAEVALCAAEQGQFWPFYDALFVVQERGGTAFIPSRIALGVEQLELDVDAFDACMEAGEKADIVEVAETFAREYPGYTGTPAVSVNDTLLEGFAPVILNAAIDEALGIAPTEETAPDDASAEPTDESTEESSDS
ncbi:MAG: thioredoxin domain-containing protein [Anaerolineae bacterium]|nr:thioredoxin domain-containing protein [Anaerolineae bacterium]